MKDPEETPKEWRRRRKDALLRCSYCPPHRGENRKRHQRHPPTKPRYKDHPGLGAPLTPSRWECLCGFVSTHPEIHGCEHQQLWAIPDQTDMGEGGEG